MRVLSKKQFIKIKANNYIGNYYVYLDVGYLV